MRKIEQVIDDIRASIEIDKPEVVKCYEPYFREIIEIHEAEKNGIPLNETKAGTDETRSYTHETRYKAVQQLKKYTETKKNTDKVEISVLELNRIIKALSQDPVDCANAEHDADGCLGYSTDRGGYSYCQTCIECPKASINSRDKEQEPCDNTSIEWYDLEGYIGSSKK